MSNTLILQVSDIFSHECIDIDSILANVDMIKTANNSQLSESLKMEDLIQSYDPIYGWLENLN